MARTGRGRHNKRKVGEEKRKDGQRVKEWALLLWQENGDVAFKKKKRLNMAIRHGSVARSSFQTRDAMYTKGGGAEDLTVTKAHGRANTQRDTTSRRKGPGQEMSLSECAGEDGESKRGD